MDEPGLSSAQPLSPPLSPDAAAPAVLPAAVADMNRPQLEARLQSNARWFYWIAALSVINSISLLVGADFNFVVGLGLTQAFSGIGTFLAKDLGPAAQYAMFSLELLVAGLFVALGLLATRGHGWALIVGFVLYILDTLLVLVFEDWMMTGFHVFVLVCLISGVKAVLALRKLPAPAQA
jgi:hypothetical protein